MKKLVLLIGCVLGVALAAAAADSELDARWDNANLSYINADYTAAAAAYEDIAREGCVSSRLFYNLGNAYFKSGNIARAILNYHKTIALSPFDRDARYNLAIANTFVKDRIDVVPEFFLSAWLRSLRAVFNANGWAVVSLVLLAVSLAAFLVFVVVDPKAWRKCGFWTGIVCFVLFVCAVVFAAVDRHAMLHPSQAVVMQQAVAVKSSPDTAGSDLFVLHEGTCVKVVSSYGSWTEIMIPDGNKGWLNSDAIELIDPYAGSSHTQLH